MALTRVTTPVINTTATGNSGQVLTAGTGRDFVWVDQANLAVGGANVTGQVANALVSGTVYTNAQPNITSVGTLSSLTVSGNISGGNLLGPLANGNSSVNIPAANGNVNISSAGNANILVVTGTGANVAGTLNATGNANVGNLGATDVVATTLGGTLTTAAQPNITSVGTLSSLTVSGNITAGNLSGILANGSSNVNMPAANGNVNISVAGNANVLIVTGTGVNVAGTINTTGNANVANLNANRVTANTISGSLITADQPNITNVGTLTSLSVTGNAVAANFIGSFANGNSVISIPAANGNVNISSAGNANILVVTGTGANISGTANVTGNVATTGVVTITRASVPTQILEIRNNDLNGPYFTSFSNPGIAKQMFFDCTTDSSNSAVTAGLVGFKFRILGIDQYVMSNTGLTLAANLGITMSGTGSQISGANTITATGNITGANFIGAFANGNSVITIPAANGNINLNAGGNATPELVITTTGVNISGTSNVTGVANFGANVNVTGNINLNADSTDRAKIYTNVSSATTRLFIETGDDLDDSISLRHFYYEGNTTLDMLTAQRTSTTEANVTVTGNFIVNSTNSLRLPVGNTAQRPSSPLTGMTRFNTSINAVEVYDNTTWNAVSGLSEYGSVVVSAALTNCAGSSTTDIQSFTLPSAGTWEVTYIVRMVNSNTILPIAIIRDTSNNLVANSEVCVGLLGVSSNVFISYQSTGTGQVYITTTGAQTFKLAIQIFGGSGTQAQVASDNSGRTRINWKKIYQV